jgi:CDP-6-deoxy-D-xylo-4-hexulose-3-dehydrase
MKYKFPLVANNITKSDIRKLINFLKKDDLILTQYKNVEKFEDQWSKWLKVKYSVFVNSGSSANLLSMAVLKEIYGEGEIIVPALTWVSDIASVLQNNFKPVFVDINSSNLCMNEEEIYKKINSNTVAVFITYVQGFNGLSNKLINFLKKKSIPLIEDVCESHGAEFNKKKLGSYGLISNFSFYYAHHMSTIEGGMICTDDKKIYEMLRMFRSHGLVRESKDKVLKNKFRLNNPSLNPQFIFAYPAYNVRSTEINAVIGLNQIKFLNQNIIKRNINHKIFLEHLDSNKYKTNFDLIGSSNYAFNLILKNPDKKLSFRLMKIMDKNKIEYRRGSAGGGNQLRQPYLKRKFKNDFKNYPVTEHIHFFGFYLGNYPSLKKNQILKLCSILNSL